MNTSSVAPKKQEHDLQSGLLVSISPVDTSLDLPATIEEAFPKEIHLKPLDSEHGSEFKNGDRIWLKHWTEEGIIRWTLQVMKGDGSENQQLVLKVLDTGTTIDRRDVPRYELKIPIAFTIVHPAERRILSREVFRSNTVSVSVAGTRFCTPVPLTTGDNIDVKLDLSGSVEVRGINVLGRVIRVEPVENAGTVLSLIAVQFLAMMPEDQEQLQVVLEKTDPSR